MTLPTNTHASANDGGSGNNNHSNISSNNNSSSDEDSDMFGPPRCSPPIGYHHHRSRVPMISPKLRQREERKRILQLCAHKMERIKDSEANLRRSVCINNTYCRLNDELRREKQMRYLQNLPRPSSGQKPKKTQSEKQKAAQNEQRATKAKHSTAQKKQSKPKHSKAKALLSLFLLLLARSFACFHQRGENKQTNNSTYRYTLCKVNSSPIFLLASASRFRFCFCLFAFAVCCVLCALFDMFSLRPFAQNQHVRTLNMWNGIQCVYSKAALSASRKRLRSNSSSEDESDRLVREALSQFYIPPQRLISAIEECPLDVVGLGMGMNVNVGGIGGIGSIGGAAGAGVEMPGGKRMKLNDHHHLNHHHHLHHHLELVDFDMNQNQKDFEVIMDALRLGTATPPSGASSDSCGQAAMMSESASVFHNLVVTSLET
ncbi:GD16372 [Drosophila simulans]|uniref:GD16372 n=1 Tax=Drosophila simulans TaxID=7240 RepID=B4R3H6_DROSI|nr:GD16372 [Drosophila simulans]